MDSDCIFMDFLCGCFSVFVCGFCAFLFGPFPPVYLFLSYFDLLVLSYLILLLLFWMLICIIMQTKRV